MENCAVCLYFDADTEDTIREWWDRLAASGISEEMPDAASRSHITLSGCRTLNVDEYAPVLKEFAASSRPIDVSLTNIGYFVGRGSTMFLAPTVTHALLECHERNHALTDGHSPDLSPLYAPGRWVPHCTLALNLRAEALLRAVSETHRFPLPVNGRLERIGIVHVARPRITEIGTYCLEGTATS